MSTFTTLNDHGLRVDFLTSLGELIQLNTGVAGAMGATWWVTGLQGWENPDTRQKFTDKAGTDGAVPMMSYFDKRSLVLQGVIMIPPVLNDSWDTQANYWNTWNFFTKVLATDLRGENTSKLTVYEIPYPKYVLCKLTGRPKFAQHPGYWEFEVNFICTDPHKYLVSGGGPGVDPGSW